MGLFHDKGDENGGSFSLFYLPFGDQRSPQELQTLAEVQRVNSKYALCGFVVEGAEVWAQLRDGDVLQSAKVQDGLWRLITPTIPSLEQEDPSEGD